MVFGTVNSDTFCLIIATLVNPSQSPSTKFQVVLLFFVRINTQTSIADQYRLSSPPPLQRA